MKKYKNLIIYSIITLFLMNIVDRCNTKELIKEQDKVAILSLEKQKLDSLVNKQGKVIKEQESVITQNKETLKNYTDSIFDLKKKNEKKIKEVIAYYKNTVKVQIDTFEVPYTDTLYVENKDSLYFEMITVPRDFEKKDSFYTIQGTVKKEGVTINKFEMTDSIYGRFIEEKKGIIKYQVFNTNPYVNITGSQSAVYKPPKKKFIDKLKEAIIYIAIGLTIGSQL